VRRPGSTALLALVATLAGCADLTRLLPGRCEVHADCASLRDPHVCHDGRCLPDQDQDFLPDRLDPCPLDPFNDIDGDGLCADLDPCPLDPLNDGDGDGVCSPFDLCPDHPDPHQRDTDGDGVGDACDPCPLDHPDDTDQDGLCDSDDPCPTGPCGLWQPCLTDDACLGGECLDGHCAPAPSRPLDTPEGPRLWTRPFTCGDLHRVHPEARADLACADGTPLGAVSWWEAMALLNRASTRDGLRPCHTLERCVGDVDTGCGALRFCPGTFVCERMTPVPGCTGYRLPTLAEWQAQTPAAGPALSAWTTDAWTGRGGRPGGLWRLAAGPHDATHTMPPPTRPIDMALDPAQRYVWVGLRPVWQGGITHRPPPAP
jgi:hypothetical protein